MYVMCIEILFHYLMIVRTRKFDIYVPHDIMRVFLFMWHPVKCNALCLTKSVLGDTYTSPLGGPMCVYVGRVWRSTMHSILPGIGKSLRLCYVSKR